MTSTKDESSDSMIKVAFRCAVVAAFFSIPIGIASPMSPLLKAGQAMEEIAYRKLVPRITKDFMSVNFLAAYISYLVLVDRAVGGNGWMPYLNPLTAQIPAMSCLIASHMFFPGQWIFIMEPSWKNKIRLSMRFFLKGTVAYSKVHVPVAVGLGGAVGLIFWPTRWKRLNHSVTTNNVPS